MEPSSSEKSDNGRLIDEALAATESDANQPGEKDGARRMVANRLLAALASGNLEHLERAREAFLHQGQDENPVPSNGKLNANSREEAPLVEQDYLGKEEAALRQAELELEQRRAEKQITGAWKKQRSNAPEKKSSGWPNWKRFAGRHKVLLLSVTASSNSTLRSRLFANQSRSI